MFGLSLVTILVWGINVEGSPVGHWKFDETSGTDAYDSSGNGHTGTVVGATWVSGVSGNALSFDGTNDYVEMRPVQGVPPDLNPTTAITVTAWFKADSFKLGSYSWPSIVRKTDPIGYPESNGYVLEIAKVYQGDPSITFNSYLAGHGWVGAAPQGLPVNKDTWYFVAGVYDGKNVSLYLGHDNQPLVAVSSPDVSGDIVAASNNLNIGRDPWKPGEDRYFNGKIDDVRIYNRALTASEVNVVYNYTPPKTYAILVGSRAPSAGNPDAVRGDLDVDHVSAKLTWATEKKIIKYDWNDADTAATAIQNAITDVASKITANDTLLFYYSGHGSGSSDVGVNEAIVAVNGGAHLDNTLTSALADGRLTNVRKLVLLDSCNSGGFWNDDFVGDQDLSHLTNVALLAAATEDTNAIAVGDGTGEFTNSILPYLNHDTTFAQLANFAATAHSGNVTGGSKAERATRVDGPFVLPVDLPRCPTPLASAAARHRREG